MSKANIFLKFWQRPKSGGGKTYEKIPHIIIYPEAQLKNGKGNGLIDIKARDVYDKGEHYEQVHIQIKDDSQPAWQSTVFDGTFEELVAAILRGKNGKSN